MGVLRWEKVKPGDWRRKKKRGGGFWGMKAAVVDKHSKKKKSWLNCLWEKRERTRG